MKKKASKAARTRKELAVATQDELTLKIEPRGPDTGRIETVARALTDHPLVRESLGKTRNRMLSFELLEPEPETKSARPASPPRVYRATFYDYTNNRTIFVDGDLDQPKRVRISESGTQPLPAYEEFEEAVKLLVKDETFGPTLRENQLRPYRPMPPLIDVQSPHGRTERTIAVGLLPVRSEARHEIVGVNLIQRAVIRFDERAPGNSIAFDRVCGPDYIQQATTKGDAGQVWITVSQGGTVLWKFLAVRPAASSGTRGSGVELRFVDYRGKRVLYRAHVPILNVHYDTGPCGPYRDWQNEEGMIQANGVDVAPGFRLCPAPATTILDTGSDAGNFGGVAIYVQGQEVVLVSEMEAGWYRYISEWRLHANGTIRPRFGFSAVQDSCVCHIHHHHPYWRFDFDIRTAGNNRVREFNDPPLVGKSNWHTKTFEIRRARDPGRKRKWRVENTATGEGYDIIPGPDDGVATASPDWPYGRGDVWILRYRGSELDDGVNCTTGGFGCVTEANLDGFVNGEPISDHDVVIWYAGHVTHDVANEPPGVFGHICGPDLKPVNW
ncbi:MAG: hypothetical protein ABI923_10535 [bacterium]